MTRIHIYFNSVDTKEGISLEKRLTEMFYKLYHGIVTTENSLNQTKFFVTEE